jgi:hypothetical protein
MNAHNNENDPFEDVFRDRFADFESEPDTQLWQKIEPKLPVDSTRKFPYWQTSAVVILLLAGLWMYREKYSDDVKTKSDEFQTKKITKSDDSRTENKTKLDELQTGNTSASDNPLIEAKATQNSTNNPLTVNDLTKKTTNKSEEKIIITKLPNRTLRNDKVSFVVNKNDKITYGNVEDKLISEGNTNIAKLPNRFLQDDKETSLVNESHGSRPFEGRLQYSTKEVIDNNFSKNNNSTLNLSLVNNSNEKQRIITENQGNVLGGSSVFLNKESISILKRNLLTTLDSKNYSLLRNYFKTPKLKFVTVPKKDDYFKERKPLEMYASVMPLLNYYTITPNGNDANFVHSIAVNGEEDRLGFYTQAGLVFTLSDRFKLRTGLTFTKTNHSINYQIRTDSLIVQSLDKQGVDVSFEELKKTYSQSANYLGTKIEVQYTFLEGEALSHYVNVGLEGAYRLNGGNQFNGFANIAYGVTRQIGDNAYLFVEPTFSYSLNQQSDNNSFLLVKPNKIGFNIGVNFKIK